MNNKINYGLRITFGYKEWEISYEHSLLVICKTLDDVKKLSQELANAYDNWQDGKVDKSVMEEHDDVYEYIIHKIETSDIETTFLETDDLILE